MRLDSRFFWQRLDGQPRMAVHLDQVQTHGRFGAEHEIQQVFELLAEVPGWVFLFMRRPERIQVATDDFEVKRILISGLPERKLAGTHEEKDDAAREEVSLLSVIGACPHLWRHELSRTRDIRGLMHRFCPAGKAEFGYLQIELCIEQQIQRLQIPMDHVLAMDVL